MSSKIFKDKDIDLSVISNKHIGIVGFGNQGKAQALNLIDSGLNVTIGIRTESPKIDFLRERNIPYCNISDLVKNCDIVVLLVPDSAMPGIYQKHIDQYLKKGQTLIFSHGYNIHYGFIKPPKWVNVAMVAPSGGGQLLRDKFKNSSGIPSLLAVENDYSGNSLDLIKAYGKGIGSGRICLFLSSFKEETETDLYGEQVLLTGGLPKMIEKSLKVLLEDGYSPLAAWFVCYYEIKMIVDLFHEKGFDYLYNAISDTARYGGLKSGDYLIDDDYEDKLKNILKDIQNGKFVKELGKNADTLKYKSSIDSKSSDEIEKIMKILFKKSKNKE